MKINKDTDANFRLRHFRTGRLLSFKTSKIDGKEFIVPILGPHLEHPLYGEDTKCNSLLNFYPTQSQMKNFIMDKQCYKLKMKDYFINVHETRTYVKEVPEKEEVEME